MRISDWSSDVCSSDLPCLDRRRDSVGPRRSALPKSVRFRPRPAGAGVRPMIRLLAAALALAAAMPVAAQTVAITGGRVLTMGPAGEIKRGTVVITGEIGRAHV